MSHVQFVDWKMSFVGHGRHSSDATESWSMCARFQGLIRLGKMHAVAHQPQSPPDARLVRSSQTLSCRMCSGPCLKDDAMIRNSMIAASLLGLALSASQPAFAGTRTVHYADLDLTTQAGQAKLDARLKTAAKAVCDLNRKDVSAAEAEAGRECFAKALADARRAKSNIKPTALATR